MNTKHVKWTVLAYSLLGMAHVGLAPMLAALSDAFPDVPTASIQIVMSIPGLFMVLISPIAGRLAVVFSKKVLTIAGLFMILTAGALGLLLHNSIVPIYIASSVLGCGMGLVMPLSASYIYEYFDGSKRSTLLGMQTTAVNGGAILLTLLAGWLTARSWEYSFLVFTLALPLIVICAAFLPRKQDEPKAAAKEALPPNEKKKKVSLPPFVFAYAAIAFIICLHYNVFPNNISLYIAEARIGSAETAGLISAMFFLGGTAAGLVFIPLSRKLDNYLFSLAFFLMAVSFLIARFSTGAGLLIVSALIGGGSISIVMPQCILSISHRVHPDSASLAFSLVISASSLAAFLSPLVFTPLSSATGNDSVSFRFLFVSVLCLIGGIVAAIIIFRSRHAGPASPPASIQ